MILSDTDQDSAVIKWLKDHPGRTLSYRKDAGDYWLLCGALVNTTGNTAWDACRAMDALLQLESSRKNAADIIEKAGMLTITTDSTPTTETYVIQAWIEKPK